MKKIVFLLLILVLIASCRSRTNTEGERISAKDYRTGTKGLELSFVKNSPPDRVFSGDQMDIIVEVRNSGAYPNTDSFDGKIEVYGYDEKAFSGERWDGGNFITPTLQGKSQFSPAGGREDKRFRVDQVNTPFSSEFYEPTIIAAACYKYRTIAEPLVCIDPEPYTAFDEKKVCTTNARGQTYSLGSQGAPVAVTKVTQETSGSNIHFGIYIKNVGTGKVVNENVINDCPLNLDYNDVDQVLAQAKLPYDANPRCQPKGDYRDPVRLDESGNGFIFCSFSKPASASAFQTVLQIQLDYRYLDTIQKKLQIVNIDR